MAKSRKSVKPKLPASNSRPRYKSHFLDRVIVRMDFASAFPVTTKGPPSEFVAAIKKRFPIPEHQVIPTQQLVFAAGQVSAGTAEGKVFLYHSKDRTRTVHIGVDCLFLEVRKYERFEDLKDSTPITPHQFGASCSPSTGMPSVPH